MNLLNKISLLIALAILVVYAVGIISEYKNLFEKLDVFQFIKINLSVSSFMCIIFSSLIPTLRKQVWKFCFLFIALIEFTSLFHIVSAYLDIRAIDGRAFQDMVIGVVGQIFTVLIFVCASGVCQLEYRSSHSGCD